MPFLSEADTCRIYITPKLHQAGWQDDQIREQVTFTHGRIVPTGGSATRKVQKRADYLPQPDVGFTPLNRPFLLFVIR